MAKEVELKLRVHASQVGAVLRHPVFFGQAPKETPLTNTYYDTPDFDLFRRGVALRLRRKGWALWLMTVKGGDAGTGGLAQRNEWEAPTQPGVFDFGIVGDAALRDFLLALQARLQPVFSTDFTRYSWLIERGAAKVEVALDRGSISAPDVVQRLGHSESLCELELELVEGDSPDVLFDLAIELACDVVLHPEIASKAERGYALAGLRGGAGPAKTFVSPIQAAMTPVEAFRAIALTCLAQVQRCEAGAMAGDDPEYVHQIRVAVRRLRSAFRLFSPVLAAAFVEVYSPRWREFAVSLGAARDWDVFLNETLSPLEEAFPGDVGLAALRTRCEVIGSRARSGVRVVLHQREYGQLLLAFAAALYRCEPPTISAEGSEGGLELAAFASRRLRKRAAAVDRLLAGRDKMSAERRHELRIEFKKLRYALEFFAPLLPEKRLRKYLELLSTAQDLLGALNDQETALHLLGEVEPGKAPSPLLRGWLAGRTELQLALLGRQLRRFKRMKRVWR